MKTCSKQGTKVFGWQWRPPGTLREGSTYRGVALGWVGSVVFHDTVGEENQAMAIMHTDGYDQLLLRKPHE